MDREKEAFFDQLYQQWFFKLLRYASVAVKNHHVAEEIVQDTFLVALQKVDYLFASEEPGRWLKQTVKYKILHYFREQKRDQILLLPLEDGKPGEPMGAGGIERIEEKEAISKLWETIHRELKPEERVLLQKMSVEGKSYQEAAIEMGCSVGACQKRMQRLRLKLREALRKDGTLEGKKNRGR